MAKRPNEWNRADAEEKIAEVFNAAKSGETQIVRDFDGSFEVKFVAPRSKQPLNEFLAQGGPVEE